MSARATGIQGGAGGHDDDDDEDDDEDESDDAISTEQLRRRFFRSFIRFEQNFERIVRGKSFMSLTRSSRAVHATLFSKAIGTPLQSHGRGVGRGGGRGAGRGNHHAAHHNSLSLNAHHNSLSLSTLTQLSRASHTTL